MSFRIINIFKILVAFVTGLSLVYSQSRLTDEELIHITTGALENEKFERIRLKGKESTNNICVDCDQSIKLASSINKVIDKLKEDDPEFEDTDFSNISNSIDELGTSIALAKEANTKHKEFSLGCNFLNDFSATNFIPNYQLLEGELLVSKSISIDYIDAIAMKSKDKSSYFYRGKGDDKNTIVIIKIVKGKGIDISYYDIGLKQDDDSGLPDLGGPSIFESKEKGTFTRLGGNKKGDKVDFGIKIEVEGGETKKISVVDVEKDLLKSSDGTTLKTYSELSNKNQHAGISLESPGSKSQISAKVDIKGEMGISGEQAINLNDSDYKIKGSYSTKDELYNASLEISDNSNNTLFKVQKKDEIGISIEVPTRISVDSSNFSVDGRTGWSKDEVSGDYTIVYDNSSLFSTSFKKHSKNGHEVSLSKKIDLSNSSSVSFKVSTRESTVDSHKFRSEESVWITFTQKF